MTSPTPSFSLNEHANDIQLMALERHYSNDYAWLAYSTFKEVGELCNTIELALATDTKEEMATRVLGEFADVIIYLLQLMNNYSPILDLDKALQAKIKLNMKNVKKTYQDGKIVRR